MSLASDVRASLRLIRRQPGFSLLAIATLGVGIGAATAVFTLVNSVLLHALPLRDPGRLVWMYNARTERDRAPFSIADLEDYARDAKGLAGVAAFTNWTANLTGIGEAERLEGTRVTGAFFPLLGARPSLGRTLDARDENAPAKVVVLTHGLWKRRFGGDPGILGQPVPLNGVPHRVVGVMPPGFLFPFRDAEVAVPLPLRDDPRRPDRGANFLRVVARLKPGVTIPGAKAELDTIARRLQARYPEDDARKTGVNLYPLQSEIVSDYRQILWTVFAAVGVLLAIGCGNLANLILVRTAGRQSELSLRVSLGATRGRLLRQLAIEAGALALMGGVLGVALANGAVAAWRAFAPPAFPRLAEVRIDSGVLAFSAAVSIVAALASGLIPAWAATRHLHEVLGSATRSVTGNRREGRMRRVFVAIQVGGSAVLLVCMGLVAKGFARLEQVDPGFTRGGALSMQLSLPPSRYSTRDSVVRFHDALAASLGSLSGVRADGAVSLLPLSGLLNTVDLDFPDRPAARPDEVPQAHFRIAGPGYFRAAGIGLLSGREFDLHDGPAGRAVAVVSRTLAERHWPGESAVGKRLHIQLAGAPDLLEVVGIVKDVRHFTVDAAPTADLYIPIHQMPASQTSAMTSRMNWVVRSEGDPRRLDRAVRSAVSRIDPEVAASNVRTLDEVWSASLNARRLNVRLLELFGQVAIALSAVGVYGIAAFSARARKRELAIRSAFGARHRDLARLVFLDELRPVAAGLAAGLLVSRLAARLLGGALFAVGPWDPVTYAAVAVGLLVAASAASYLPARRAAGANPAELLRT